jgi:hypothetical protein
MNALTVLLLLLAVPFSLLYLALNVVVVKLLLAGVEFFRYGKRAADAGRARLSSEPGQPSSDLVAAKPRDARSRAG